MTNPLVSLRTKTSDFIAKRRENKKDRGAGFVEYGAIILLIAAIVAAVFALDIEDKVSGLFEKGIEKVEKETGVNEGGDDGADDDATDDSEE